MKTQEQIIAEYEAMQAERQRNILCKRPTKTNKKKLLVLQNNQCSFCKANIEVSDYFCYDKLSNKVVCRCCMSYLIFWRKLRARGITEAMTVEFNG